MKKNIFERIQQTTKRMSSPMGFGKKEPLKEMTMREMLRRTRRKNIKEDEEPTQKSIGSDEQKQHERNMLDFFENENLTIKFEPIMLYDEGVFWGGTIDGQLKFAYFVTPDESTSGVKIERSPDFDPSNEDNQKVEKKVVDYYDTFYKYWSENELEK
jgi:hypothetical protein